MNWDCGRAVPFPGIYVSNFRYSIFAVRPSADPHAGSKQQQALSRGYGCILQHPATPLFSTCFTTLLYLPRTPSCLAWRVSPLLAALPRPGLEISSSQSTYIHHFWIGFSVNSQVTYWSMRQHLAWSNPSTATSGDRFCTAVLTNFCDIKGPVSMDGLSCGWHVR